MGTTYFLIGMVAVGTALIVALALYLDRRQKRKR